MIQEDLIEAVKTGNLMSVKELIGSGTNINQQDRHGWTPLCWAAGKGELSMIRALVENGADVLKTGIDQRTPAMIAVAASHVDAASFLLETGEAHPDYRGQPKREYCMAFHMKDLRQYPSWQEGREEKLPDETIVYLHEDLHVTRSIWSGEGVVFSDDTPEWRRFCEAVLNFAVPSDLELIGPAKNESALSGANA